MIPFVVLKWKDEPGSGEIAQLVTVPPELVGPECGLIATPRVALISFNEYEMEGAISFTVIVIFVEEFPPIFLAVTV